MEGDFLLSFHIIITTTLTEMLSIFMKILTTNLEKSQQILNTFPL